jgi:hypothetical protein
MVKIKIDLDKETEEKLKSFTQSKNISPNEWIIEIIQEKLADEWPAAVINLVGAWKDIPDIAEIRQDINQNHP